MRAQIYLRVSMDNEFVIPLNGLAAGENRFFWQAGKEFFEGYDNTEVLDAQLDIKTLVDKSGRYIGVDCDITGWLVVECDRCLEDLNMPIDVEVRLSVKFGEVDSSEEIQDGEREVIFLPVDNTELDMSQIVYDYVCTSLPLQRVHKEGECNPIAMKYYGSQKNEEASEEVAGDNPFAALKGLFQ